MAVWHKRLSWLALLALLLLSAAAVAPGVWQRTCVLAAGTDVDAINACMRSPGVFFLPDRRSMAIAAAVLSEGGLPQGGAEILARASGNSWLDSAVLARAYWRQGQPDQAAALLRERYPERLWLWAAAQMSTELAGGRPEEAVRLLERYLPEELDAPPVTDKTLLYQNAYQAYARLGRYDAALTFALHLSGLFPQNAVYWRWLAEAQYHQGDYAGAERSARQSLAVQSTAAGWYWLGAVMFKQGNLAQAEAHLQRAVALDPTWHAAYLDLARVYHQRREDELARQTLVLVLRNAPDTVWAERAGVLLAQWGLQP